MKTKLILASSSPRRREIFDNLGFEYEIITTNAEENADIRDMTPEQTVRELAIAKGRAIAEKISGCAGEDCVIVSADTVVAASGKILEKPKNREEAREMLTSLSGKKHSVLTGLCVLEISSRCNKERTVVEKTDVYFKKLSEEMTEAYLDTGEYADKAGAYGIQGIGAMLVEKIKGDYFNVVGFPINSFYELLKQEFSYDMFRPDEGFMKRRGKL